MGIFGGIGLVCLIFGLVFWNEVIMEKIGILF